MKRDERINIARLELLVAGKLLIGPW